MAADLLDLLELETGVNHHALLGPLFRTLLYYTPLATVTFVFVFLF